MRLAGTVLPVSGSTAGSSTVLWFYLPYFMLERSLLYQYYYAVLLLSKDWTEHGLTTA